MSVACLTVALWGDPHPVGAGLLADGARVIALSGAGSPGGPPFESFDFSSADLCSSDAASGLVGALWEKVGPVRGLLVQPILGGAGDGAPHDETGRGDLALSESKWRDALGGALKVPFFLARAFAARMEEAGGGSIVAVAAAKSTRPSLIADVARDALVTWTLAVAKALPGNVRIHAVIGPRAAAPSEDSSRGVVESALFLLGATALPSGVIIRLDREP